MKKLTQIPPSRDGVITLNHCWATNVFLIVFCKHRYQLPVETEGKSETLETKKGCGPY